MSDITPNIPNSLKEKEDSESDEEDLDSPFEIRKKQIKLFNKNITLQIFDTSDEFHKNSISNVYYKTVSAFFIFIEASKNNSNFIITHLLYIPFVKIVLLLLLI